MRSFQHPQTLDPVPGDVVATLRRIDRAAGAEGRYADQLPQLLEALRAQARVESITASSFIEGVVVDDARVPKLVSGATGGSATVARPSSPATPAPLTTSIKRTQGS
jgi:hypothetical protein